MNQGLNFKEFYIYICTSVFYLGMSTMHCYAGPQEPGGGGQEADLPLDFSRSVDPIPIRVANYAHHITTCPTPGFSDPPTALKSTVYNLSLKICQNAMFDFSISSFPKFFIASCFSSDLFVISFPCVIYWGVFCPIVS